jgi:hypothetical protein
MEKTHWRKIIESDYLAGADLDDGNGKHRDIIVTIREAKSEKVMDPSTKKEEVCLVLYFKEQVKPMICNVTNAKAISKQFNSDYIQDWADKRIQIGTEPVKAFGELWNALRIRPRIKEAQPAAQNKPAIICASCDKPIQPYGAVTPEEIAAKTVEKYGKQMCLECATRMKGGQNDAAK